MPVEDALLLIQTCTFPCFQSAPMARCSPRSLGISKLQCAVLLCLGCPPILCLDVVSVLGKVGYYIREARCLVCFSGGKIQIQIYLSIYVYI